MPEQFVRSLGGVARTPELITTGVSRHKIERALNEGRLARVRRGWVALPTANSDLVFAAQHSLTLSCITQAKRLGLWVREHPHAHFVVPQPGAETRPQRATLHYNRPVVPRQPYALADEIENVLDLVAHCLPHEDAVATWDSALNKGLVNRLTLERLPLIGRAREVFDDSSPFADSGLESYVRQRLRWLGLKVLAQAWVHGRRVDFLIGERLILQIDGAHHVGAQRTADIEHDAQVQLQGYTVIRVSYEQVMGRWHEVQAIVMRAVAQGLHLARSN